MEMKNVGPVIKMKQLFQVWVSNKRTVAFNNGRWDMDILSQYINWKQKTDSLEMESERHRVMQVWSSNTIFTYRSQAAHCIIND